MTIRRLWLLLVTTTALASGPQVPPELLSFCGQGLPEVSRPYHETHFAPKVLELDVTEPYRFVVCCDIHENLPRLRRAVDAIIEEKPAFVVFLGDLTDRFEKGHVDRMVAELARITVPFLPVMGNHERMGGRYAKYLARFGPPNYAIRAGSSLFVAIDSSRGFLPRPVLEWLEERLAQGLSLKRRFIITHVPPADPRPEEHHCLGEASARSLRSLATRFRVNSVFTGHLHLASQVEHGGVRYISGGVVGGRIYDLPQCGGYYHMLAVDVAVEKTTVRTVPLGSSPGAFSVWAGDIKMRAVYRTKLMTSDPESREFDRLSRRMTTVRTKFERYRRRLARELAETASRSGWILRARKDIEAQKPEIRDELLEQLSAICALKNP